MNTSDFVVTGNMLNSEAAMDGNWSTVAEGNGIGMPYIMVGQLRCIVYLNLIEKRRNPHTHTWA